MNTTHVLVLNQNYEPLAVAKIGRALALVGRSKADILEYSVEPIVTPSCSLDRPSVIRLLDFIKRPRPRVRYGRQNVFKRDHHTCQYCGKQPRDLTIDHVMPLSRGGKDTWENTVAACTRCNRKKGARTPDEAGMALIQKPYEPKLTSYLHLTAGSDHPQWSNYFPSAAVQPVA